MYVTNYKQNLNILYTYMLKFVIYHRNCITIYRRNVYKICPCKCFEGENNKITLMHRSCIQNFYLRYEVTKTFQNVYHKRNQ